MRTLLLIAAVLSCGPLPEGDETDTNPAAAEVRFAKEKGVAESARSSARLVQTVADETCDETTLHDLIYSLDDEEFYACDGETWASIKIKGKDGKDGVDGTAGANGRDGADGAPGKDGANGKDGVDGMPGKDGDKTLLWIYAANGKPVGYAADPTAITAIPMILEMGKPAIARNLAEGFSGDTPEVGVCSYLEPDCAGGCYKNQPNKNELVFVTGGTGGPDYGTITLGTPIYDKADSSLQIVYSTKNLTTGNCVNTTPAERLVSPVAAFDFPLPWRIEPRSY